MRHEPYWAGGQKSLLCDPGSESQLGGRENRRVKIINGIEKIHKYFVYINIYNIYIYHWYYINLAGWRECAISSSLKPPDLGEILPNPDDAHTADLGHESYNTTALQHYSRLYAVRVLLYFLGANGPGNSSWSSPRIQHLLTGIP